MAVHHMRAIAIAVALRHAVIAVTHAVVRAVIHARRQGVTVMIAVHAGMVAVVMVIATPNANRVFLIDTIRREVTGTGVGRALVGVVVLMHGRGVIAVLHFRIGQPLIAPAAAAAAIVAARIDRGRQGLPASGVKTARACRYSAGGHYGDCRDHSRNRMTHYSLLFIAFLIFFCCGRSGLFSRRDFLDTPVARKRF